VKFLLDRLDHVVAVPTAGVFRRAAAAEPPNRAGAGSRTRDMPRSFAYVRRRPHLVAAVLSRSASAEYCERSCSARLIKNRRGGMPEVHPGDVVHRVVNAGPDPPVDQEFAYTANACTA